jgi:hypothetical protein
MNNVTHVKIIIVLSDIELNKIPSYSPEIYGTQFSTLTEVHGNKTNYGYSILYKDNIFEQFDTAAFGETLLNVINNQFPTGIVELEIHYEYLNFFKHSVGESVVQLDDFLSGEENERIVYNESDVASYLYTHYDNQTREFDFSNDNYEEETQRNTTDDDDEDDDEEEDDLFGAGHIGTSNKYPSQFESSSILSNANNARRDIRRHRIIISSNRKARKHDKNTIHDFLEVFIAPNKDSKWIREYRKLLAERWVSAMVISRRDAKRIARKYKEQQSRPNGESITEKVLMRVAKRVLTPVASSQSSNSLFSDPNR